MPVLSRPYGILRRGSKALAAIVAVLLLAGRVAAADPVTILALGDSLTAGYGLAPEQGFVPQLQDWLGAQGQDVVVLNGGVSGDTTAAALARLDWALSPEVDAMIVTLGGNDVLRGLDPGEAKANLDAILSRADALGLPVLLVGMQAAGNYGQGYKTAFDGMYPALAEAHGALLAPSFFAGLGAGGDPAAARGLMQADGLHPNPDGVKKIVAALGPYVEQLIQKVR